jgi:HEAT repeat protein
MQAAELTLAAALRDATAPRPQARVKAIQNLAPALLAELEVPGPHWQAAHAHARGAEVTATLSRALDDDDPAIAALAAVGLGTIGDPDLLGRIEGWLERDDGDDPEGAQFVRECAAIAVSLLGAAAPKGHAVRERVLEQLRASLGSDRPDVRFQAPIGMVEVGDAQVETELLAALKTESESAVRTNIVVALARLHPTPPATCNALERLLQTEAADDEIGFEAAMILAGARRVTARPRLLRALHHRGERDRALEALAVLGRAQPSEIEPVHRLATRVWTPGVTRVRAAYALARMAGERPDDPGPALLARLRFHPRACVREAVRDALLNLGTLARDP